MTKSLLAALALLLAGPVAAATLTLGVLQRADDERLAPARIEQAYPGHPGGSLQAAVELAIDESRFALDAAKLRIVIDVHAARSADEATALLQQLARAGALGVVLDLPTAWIAALKAAATPALLNAGAGDEALRQQGCAPQLFHTLPSERMRADALAQALLARRWSRVLLLHGPGDDDAQRLALAQAALKRHGLKLIATRAFRRSADPRERELANPRLLTSAAGGDYDAVWVVDSDGEFARGLPYNTVLPRPVVGDAGLVAVPWAAHFERYGSPQLARRFMRAARRPMTGHDWAGYIAAKAILQAALEQPVAPNAAQVLRALQRSDFALDGFKGVRLGFRAWDRQLRQPLLLSDGLAVLGSAPVDGVLHPVNVLDTLGSDAAESACKAGL
ncbi:branched-chain amino acid ABC transporter substrate-binding protein [Aquincola sp. S2]|uniref:Branched-chain amino acid ABC transporter substrate-binding protein n=1 Tax=Pseudaquabacterium terrae TaxID=2732868 RepID=A0ABX2ERB2_9BURK|nr:branched-chain amino acid ABC transporter substrate-binding protein [Aquabacterium terrae]NRF70989.1 branched-chain amino acid ABC transporter substrate-binding protein [Aquabacterium terrae]